MPPLGSQMAREAAEAARGAERQLTACTRSFAELARRLQDLPPPVIVTCARGSSDHAASYGKYLIETTVGRAVASVGPSVVSSYGRVPIGLEGALFVAVSQSGKSPDLLELTRAARDAGALVVGMLNDEHAPLAGLCEIVIPLCAGEERGVAATKSFLLAGLAFLQLVAAWTDDDALRAAATAAPDAFAAAAALDWTPALLALAPATSMYVLGRGVGLAAALEVALKLKETSRLHAEAFSTAEVLHGPVALVGPGFPVLALGQDDETAASTRATVAKLIAMGAAVCSTLDTDGATLLPTLAGVPPVLAPLCHVQSFYLAAPQLARARGLDPDRPSHLAKVTRTV